MKSGRRQERCCMKNQLHSRWHLTRSHAHAESSLRCTRSNRSPWRDAREIVPESIPLRQTTFDANRDDEGATCTHLSPFAELIKSSSGGPLTCRSAPAFTSSGGSARELISWLLTDTSFSKGQASARSTLNTETGGLKTLSTHASMWGKRRTSESASPYT